MFSTSTKLSIPPPPDGVGGGQVHHDARRSVQVADPVDAGLAADLVVAESAVEEVVAEPAVEEVVSGSTADGVAQVVVAAAARVADERVVAERDRWIVSAPEPPRTKSSPATAVMVVVACLRHRSGRCPGPR